MGRTFTRHVVIAAAIGAVVALVMWLLFPRALAPTISWDAAAITFLVLTWRHILPMDADSTRTHAGLEAPTRTATDVVVLTAALLSLVTVVVVLFRQFVIGSFPTELRALLGVVAVVLAWAVLHTVYTLRYARMYYSEPQGGIDFNGDQPPAYTDFAYVAFGVGMAFQIADTNTQTTLMRKTVLAHALLSFLFATTILAVTINLVAGLKP